MSITRYNPEAPIYVVMCDYGRTGLEAVTYPGTTLNRIIEEVATGEYYGPQYVLEIRDGVARDISETIATTVVGLAEQDGMTLADMTIAFCQEYEALPVDCSAFEGGAVVRSEAA